MSTSSGSPFIERIVVAKLDAAYHHPLVVPLGVVDGARNVIVRIDTNEGVSGWGEAAPFAPITGDSQDTNFETAKVLANVLKGENPLAIDDCMNKINRITVGDSSVRSAFDMALYDIAAKKAGMPLFRFLGGARREIRTDLTIGLQDTPEESVVKAKEIVRDGFEAIKLKVGRPGYLDVEHVRAVRRAVGPSIAIKVDTNQCWALPTAIANLKAMANLDLQYSEQPLPYWDVDGLAQLRQSVDLPICVDESVFTHHDALRVVKSQAADIINIKLGKAGGIHSALKVNAIAEAAGLKCMIGCFSETRLGLSASAHLAMARANICFLDLDSAFYISADPVVGGIMFDEVRGGVIHVSDDPGLGAEISEDHLRDAQKYEVLCA